MEAAIAANTGGAPDWTLITPALAVEVVIVLLVLAFWLWVLRQNEVRPGPRNEELGPEPPAVVNLLTHGMKLTSSAAAATALDLSARGYIEIDEINSSLSLVRVARSQAREDLRPFEARLLDELESLEVDGVVPAEACNFGPEALSWRWWRKFSTEVGDDAVERGLAGTGPFGEAWMTTSNSVLSRWWLATFLLLIVPPGLLALGTKDSSDAASYAVLFSFIVPLVAACSITRARYVATEAGRYTASRWLGTRAALSEGEFDQYSPASVAVWGRPLAYAVALGLAKHVARGMPFGAEDDSHGWSSAHGMWHPIRIAYPMWLPGWGRRTGRVVAVALAVAVVAFIAANGMWSWEAAPGARPTAIVLYAIAALALLESVIAAIDLGPPVVIDGEVIRLRARFPDFDRGLLTIVVHRPRWFVAVDTGRSRVHAISIRETDFNELAEGDHVRLTVSRFFKCARTIRVIDDPEGAERLIRSGT
jgi:Predicted membrane protein (DUF2207)